MASEKYGVELRYRLGEGGFEALQDMMDDRQKELVTVDRFERRLAEEAAARREDTASVRLEIANVRVEMAGVRQDLSQQIATVRFDLIKWMFVFWVGHGVTTIGLVVAVLRFMRP